MILRLLPVMLLALAGCATNDQLPVTRGAERPAWLPVQPEQYERYPVPEAWRDDSLAKYPGPGTDDPT